MNISPSCSLDLETQSRLEPIVSPNDLSEIAIYTPLKVSVFKISSSISPPSLCVTQIHERDTHTHLVDPAAEAVCIAWKRDRTYKYIFAVGFNNGKVILLNLSPNQRDCPHYINNVYDGGNRTCTSLVWHPLEFNLLAIGFPHIKMPLMRPDQSLRIWDVNCSFEQVPGALGSLFPAITTDHISSLCWMADYNQSLVYCNRNGVGSYNYRKLQLCGKPTRSKAIHGLCADTVSHLYVANFYENRVRVWSVEDLTQSPIKMDTAHPVLSIAWFPQRPRTLLVLTSYPEVYLLLLPSRCRPFYPNLGIEMEASGGVYPPFSTNQEATHWQRIHSCESLHRIHSAFPTSHFSLLPHPTSRNAFFLVQSPAPSSTRPPGKASIQELSLPTFLSVTLSPSGTLVSASDLQLATASLSQEMSAADCMRSHVQAGYCFDSKKNLEVCREEPVRGRGRREELVRLWEWVVTVDSGLEGSTPRTQLCDVMLNGLAKRVLREVRIDRTQSDYCDVSLDSAGQRAVPRWQQSSSRELCLRLLGWLPPQGEEEGRGGIGRTALCWLLASPDLEVNRAIQALQSVETGALCGEIGAVVMALAGYSSQQNRLWVDTCLSQAASLRDPYLRLCVRVLYSDYSVLAQTIRQEHISSIDKFALACAYLRDRDLDKFGSDLLKQIQDQSLLEGLFLTGLGQHGLAIMKKYLAQGGDLLTVCVLSSLALKYSQEIGTSLSEDTEKYIRACWSSLCDFLDQCRLWKERCLLEMERNRLIDSKPLNHHFKWNVLCGFCGKAISGGDRKEIRGRRSGAAHPTPEKVSSTRSCCPACLKPLPRCVVCHRHMGSSANHVPNGSSVASTPTDDWMTWCQTCCHWGHSKHLSDWFRENPTCPAPGCSCPCLSKDNQLLS